MNDRRITPNPDWVTQSEPGQIIVPVVDLCASAKGPRDRQLLLGDDVTALGQQGDFTYLRTEKDGYHGFVPFSALQAQSAPTHRVQALATHSYDKPDFKSVDRHHLSFGARLTALSETEGFVETAHGFVPKQHLADVTQSEGDPVAIAIMFLGTPYLWGGNSCLGIDCSGLVQAALLACGVPCPGDSDLQFADLGTPLAEGSAKKAGDLLFWKGHVAMLADPDTLIHANAHHMATRLEGLEAAMHRITDPFLGHIRP